MNEVDLLSDAFVRVRQSLRAALEGLDEAALTARVDGTGNSIAWLAWHLTRVQDDHVAAAAGSEQVWHAAGWQERFDLPLDRDDTGYGHSSQDVAAVHAPAELLASYHDAVHARTLEYLATLDGEALDRVVDEDWDPPVTLGVRLVSVVGDDLQHVGQAAFVRGLVVSD